MSDGAPAVEIPPPAESLYGEGAAMARSSKTQNPHFPTRYLISVALAIGLSSSACVARDPTSQLAVTNPVTLTIGFPNFTGQDPLRGIQQAARLISHEGLASLSRDGRPQPKLAAGWTNSADGLSWAIQLRHEARFHDGTSVDAASVKRSLERSLASSDRTLAPGLADISSLEVLGAFELVIHLRNRSSFLLEDLTVPITRLSDDGAVVATGPYVITRSEASQIEMEAFPKHYRGTPKISRIVWRPYATVRTAWAAMMRGEVDFLYEVGHDAREFIENETSVKVFPFLRNYVYAVIFNSRTNKFTDPRIRQALSYAVNRQRIVSLAFKGHARPISGFAWPEHWAYDTSAADHGYDPTRASALLNSSPRKVTMGEQGRPAARLHFKCLFPENLPLWERIALLMQRDLAQIGVDMEVESVPISEFNNRLATGDFDTVLLELIVGNSASRPFTFWHSESRQNMWGYNSQSVESALEQIRRAANEIEYRDGFRNFQRYMLDDPPAVFLALGETSRAVSTRFVVTAPPRSDILPTIADWQIALREDEN